MSKLLISHSSQDDGCARAPIGGSEQALALLDEAQQRFEAIAKDRANKGAERMAGKCFAERGDCLLAFGRAVALARFQREELCRYGRLDRVIRVW